MARRDPKLDNQAPTNAIQRPNAHAAPIRAAPSRLLDGSWLSAMIVMDILSTAVSLGRNRLEQSRIAEMKRLLFEVRSGGNEKPDDTLST